MQLFFWTYGDGKGYKFDESEGRWVRIKKKKEGGIIDANTEFGEVMGILQEFQGALTYKQITEEFTIPQINILLKDKPIVDIDSSEGSDKEKKIEGKADNAADVLNFLTKK